MLTLQQWDFLQIGKQSHSGSNTHYLQYYAVCTINANGIFLYAMTATESKYELFRNYANKETIEAVEESMRGEYAGVADCSSFESFKKSLGIYE